MRPLAGVIPVPLEAVQAGNVRDVGCRKATDCSNQIGCGKSFARFGLDVPAVCSFVIVRLGDTSVQKNIALQVKSVGDVMHVAHDFGLLWVALRPFPLFNQFL